MSWDDVRGHSVQREMFRRAIRRGRLSHAYLFSGPDGIGKKLFARRLAQCLFCTTVPDDELDSCGECPSCRQMAAGTHADFLFAECPEGKSEFPIDLIAGAKPRRGREGLCYELSLSPLSGSRKIAVIDDVDLMNAESANAFLKTLEEPPHYATLILLSANPDSLLPTIRSRCQLVRFSSLSENDIAGILTSQNLVENPDDAVSLAALSRGSLSMAVQLADPQLREIRLRVRTAIAGGDFQSTQIAAEVTTALETLGETPAQRLGAVWLVGCCIEFYRQAMRSLCVEASTSPASPADSFLDGLTADRADALEMLAESIECGDDASRQIERNAPVSLCLHGYFGELSQIRRRLLAG